MNSIFIDNRLCAIEQELHALHSLFSEFSACQLTTAPKEILTISECSKLTGLSKSTLYKKVSNRLIPCYKSGKQILFKQHEVLDWMLRSPRETVVEIESKANNFVNKK